MRVLLLLACAASLAPQDPPRDLRPAASPPGTAEIRGRVLAADTGAPIPRARVNLTPVPSLSVTPGIANLSRSRATEAGPDGRYVIAAVHAGEYYLSASDAESRATYLRSSHGAKGPHAPGESVTVAEGQQIHGIDVRLPPAAVIAGQVLDDAGYPVAHVMVSPLRWTGSRPVRSGLGVTTDDRGRYRLFGLTPGEYLVAAEARPPTQNTERRAGLITTYSPAASGVSEARIVHAAGGQVAEADIRMVRSHMVALGGLLLDVRGQPVSGGSITLTHGESLETRGTTATTNAQGRFTFRNLVPGPYRLVGRAYFSGWVPPGGGRELAVMDLHLAEDVEDLVVMSQPGSSVRLDVHFENQPPDGMRVNLSAVSAERGESLLGGRAPETVMGPASVVLSDLFGPVLFRASGMSPRWFVKEIRYHGRDITDEPTVFRRQDTVQVIMSDRPATLEGIVSDPSGTSGRPGDVVFIFGDDPGTWIPRSSMVRTTPVLLDGRYSASGLRPGTYYVAALRFADAASLSEPAPRALEALSRRAVQVVVGAGETRRVELTFVEGAIQ